MSAPTPPRRRPSLTGVVVLSILAMVVTPAALTAGMGLMWIGLASCLVTGYGMLAP